MARGARARLRMARRPHSPRSTPPSGAARGSEAALSRRRGRLSHDTRPSARRPCRRRRARSRRVCPTARARVAHDAGRDQVVPLDRPMGEAVCSHRRRTRSLRGVASAGEYSLRRRPRGDRAGSRSSWRRGIPRLGYRSAWDVRHRASVHPRRLPTEELHQSQRPGDLVRARASCAAPRSSRRLRG